jgi:glycosyltransferase involved in cell wall biosynthesis
MLKKDKLVLMIASSIGGGAQILLLNLAQNLKKQFELMIFCPNGYLSKELQNAGFNPNICNINIITIGIIRKKVLLWAQNDKFIVNPFLFGTAFYASLAFGHNSKSKIFSLLLNPIVRMDLGILKKFAYIKIAKYIGKYSKGIGVGSPELREEVEKLTGVSPFYLENRVPNTQKFRSRFYNGFDGEFMNVCFVGRFAEQKRPDIFIETALITCKAKANINYYMVGEGHFKQHILRYISDNNLSDCVTLLGFISDIYPFLHKMDVLLCTSEYENTPLIILNAMNASLPVVAGNVKGIPHLITNGINGIIIEEYSPKGFSEALLFLAARPNLIKIMSINAYEHAITDYSYDKFVQEYVALLKKFMLQETI